MNCKQLINNLGFDNRPVIDFKMDRPVIEIEPKDGWRRWKLDNKIQLNITLNQPE